MNEARNVPQSAQRTVKIFTDKHPDGRDFEDSDYPVSSDMKVNELRSLLKEVLESRIIRPHFSRYEAAFLLDEALIGRIMIALL